MQVITTAAAAGRRVICIPDRVVLYTWYRRRRAVGIEITSYLGQHYKSATESIGPLNAGSAGLDLGVQGLQQGRRGHSAAHTHRHTPTHRSAPRRARRERRARRPPVGRVGSAPPGTGQSHHAAAPESDHPPDRRPLPIRYPGCTAIPSILNRVSRSGRPLTRARSSSSCRCLASDSICEAHWRSICSCCSYWLSRSAAWSTARSLPTGAHRHTQRRPGQAQRRDTHRGGPDRRRGGHCQRRPERAERRDTHRGGPDRQTGGTHTEAARTGREADTLRSGPNRQRGGTLSEAGRCQRRGLLDIIRYRSYCRLHCPHLPGSPCCPLSPPPPLSPPVQHGLAAAGPAPVQLRDVVLEFLQVGVVPLTGPRPLGGRPSLGHVRCQLLHGSLCEQTEQGGRQGSPCHLIAYSSYCKAVQNKR